MRRRWCRVETVLDSKEESIRVDFTPSKLVATTFQHAHGRRRVTRDRKAVKCTEAGALGSVSCLFSSPLAETAAFVCSGRLGSGDCGHVSKGAWTQSSLCNELALRGAVQDGLDFLFPSLPPITEIRRENSLHNPHLGFDPSTLKILKDGS